MGIKSVIAQLQAERERARERDLLPRVGVEIEPRRVNHPNQRMPELNDWRVRCPNACWDFTAKSKLLPVVPAQSQENAVVADLLLVVTGISGRYITPDRSSFGVAFVIAEGLESCYVQMTKSILPLAAAYTTVSRFIEEKRGCHCGRVNHALAAGLDRLCRDYLSVLSQLSTQHRYSRLNLQTLYSRLQPYLHIFQTLAEVCEKVTGDVRGGKTLTILNDAARKASGKTESLLQHLLETSAVPYMQQLYIWLTQGIVDDPYSEFLIEDNQVIFQKEILPEVYSDEYWEKCYTVSKDRVPGFLDAYTTMILSTGKYLNVLRQCGIGNCSTSIPPLVYSCTENLYAESIRKASEVASETLLKYIMVDMDLPGHLRSIRNYFLLAQGDMHTKFMDIAATELNKDVLNIVPGRLETFLELALRTSGANGDPYKDLLHVHLIENAMMTFLVHITPEHRGPTGWEALCFCYDPPWPISLILNRTSLTSYQLLCRHLLYCRHVERLLQRVWLEHKKRELWSAWDLRQRMLLYVHNLEYYMLVEVIEPLWSQLMQKLPNCRNLDEVLTLHSDFTYDSLIKCLVTNPQHLAVLNTFLSKCVDFCKFMDACGMVEASPVHTTKPAVDFTQGESFSAKISEFNKIFTQHLHYLFRTLRESDSVRRSDRLTDILYRLDYNSYYAADISDRSRSHEFSKSTESVASDATFTPPR